jgi:hypothetical protein
MRLPKFSIPRFNPQDQWLIIALLVLAAMVFFAALSFTPHLNNARMVAIEAPLVKNARLGVSPGDVYTYSYAMGNESDNISYLVGQGPGCTVVKLAGGQANSSVCLDARGNDATMQNSTYAVPVILLTRPWMLAVRDGWRWNVSDYMVFDTWPMRLVDTNYTVVRKEDYRGREAYVVRVESSEGNLAMDWVDAEKRILLREAGQGYEITLVNGLPLD